MKYYEIVFRLKPCSDDAQDVLAALAAEAGCESFEPVPTGLKAYAQQLLFDREALDANLQDFPFSGVTVVYDVAEAEDKNWNEQWEKEGFAPIVIGNRLVIHDGRHLPDEETMNADTLRIEIDAHLAFGTGTHETTRMLCGMLLAMPLQGVQVVDAGCGTGILGITALKLGAAHATAYDIDEWSTENTRHNAIINQVESQMQVLCGDATLLDQYAKAGARTGNRFNLVMANINRNILLQDMERFASVMAKDATLLLSGFYESDCPLLESKAQTLGLRLVQTQTDGEWAAMMFHS